MQTLMEKRMKPWINKKMVELIGEEEPALAEFLCQKVLSRADPALITKEIAAVRQLYLLFIHCTVQYAAVQYTVYSTVLIVRYCTFPLYAVMTVYSSYESIRVTLQYNRFRLGLRLPVRYMCRRRNRNRMVCFLLSS